MTTESSLSPLQDMQPVTSGVVPGRSASSLVQDVAASDIPQPIPHWAGFDQAVFAERRRRLLSQLPVDAILILPTAPVRIRNRDAEYRYRTDSSFYYLTGFAEPESVLVLQHGAQPFTLFCRERDPAREQWDGLRLGLDGVMGLGADQAFAIASLAQRLPELLQGKTSVYLGSGRDPELDQQIMRWLGQGVAGQRAGQVAPEAVRSADSLIDAMRLLKDAAEIAAMQQAADITALAHVRAMQRCRPGEYEYALEAEINYIFGRHGAQSAYNAIVGGGDNACILHYTENNQLLQDGDLVLIDAGCELDHYAADITRTFPVNGRFTAAQHAIYQLVLDAQLAAIAAIRPGRSWDDFHQAAVRVLAAGLIELGILSGSLDAVIEQADYKRFYMHRTGHWLGMDVHDVGRYQLDGEQEGRPLQPGMVLTVEPGLYFNPQDEQVPEPYRGIGVRIEDDVLVTAQGARVLTAGVPKTISEIEQLMARSAAENSGNETAS